MIVLRFYFCWVAGCSSQRLARPCLQASKWAACEVTCSWSMSTGRFAFLAVRCQQVVCKLSGAISRPQEGPAERGHVKKKRQKSSLSCQLVPVIVSGVHPPKPPLGYWKPPLCEPPTFDTRAMPIFRPLLGSSYASFRNPKAGHRKGGLRQHACAARFPLSIATFRSKSASQVSILPFLLSCCSCVA